MTTTERKIGALAPWFGANRERSELVGQAIGRVAWACVPFMGGGAELPHINCVEGVASDKHRHVINLAKVVADPELLERLARRLDRTLFHEETYREAKRECLDRDEQAGGSLFAPPAESKPSDAPDVEWAYWYFATCWMGPGAMAGKDKQFGAYFPVRFSSSGGASTKRFRSAVESLDAWCAALRPWQFVRADAEDVLARVEAKDRDRRKSIETWDGLGKPPTIDPWGVYCDPPWPEAGREYQHQVDDDRFHERLERQLRGLTTCRVVVRYGEHPLIRGLYDGWVVLEHETKNQAGNALPELLMSNAPFRIREAA